MVTRAFSVVGFPMQYANSLAIVDNVLQMLNQIVFPNMQLGNDVLMQQNPDFYDLVYNLGGNSSAQVSFFVGLSQFKSDLEITQLNYLNSLMQNNTQKYLNKITDLPLNCFDYKTAIQQLNISYIAIRDFTQIPRFSDDPMFSLVFKNDRVAIFKIMKS